MSGQVKIPQLVEQQLLDFKHLKMTETYKD